MVEPDKTDIKHLNFFWFLMEFSNCERNSSVSILLRCKTPRFRAQPAESISDYENNALINMHDTAKSDYSVSSTLPSPYPTIKKNSLIQYVWHTESDFLVSITPPVHFHLRKLLLNMHDTEESDSSVSCTTCRVHIQLWKELLNPPTPATIFKNLSTVPLGSWSSNPLEFLRVLFSLLKYGISFIFGFF